MRFGSVCSGIEAASMAWLGLGWEAAWFSEIEPFPCQILKRHYPNIPNYGDMTKLIQRILSEEIEAPDILCGGTPCQAFSWAGLGESLDDARGQLTLIFCEIADAIDTVRRRYGKPPCVIFWENVEGVLSTKDNAFGCLLGKLSGDQRPIEPGPKPETGKDSRYWRWAKKLGFHVPKWTIAGSVIGQQRRLAWRVLNAEFFNLAQRRNRVFVVGSARSGFDPCQILFEFDGMRRNSPPCREAQEEIAQETARRIGSGGERGTFDGVPTGNLFTVDGTSE